MISVIVCTCNRADKLGHLLDSFERLQVPVGLAWELIVVDNNSMDGTARLLDAFAVKTALPLRRSFEKNQGLAVAHNHALRIAGGDIIALTDDDCRVSADWLTVIAREFGGDPALCMLGGRVELFNPADFPITIRTGREPLDLTGDNLAMEVVLGCNMVIRRAALDRLGAFDVRFGVGCGVVPSGDDTDLIYRFVRAGVPIRYAPDLVILHDHGRSTGQQVAALRHNYLLGRGGFYAKYLLQGDRTIARLAFWEVRNLLRGAFRPDKRGDNLTFLATLLRGALRFIRGAKAVALPPPGRT